MNTFLVGPRTKCAGRFVTGADLQERNRGHRASLLRLLERIENAKLQRSFFILCLWLRILLAHLSVTNSQLLPSNAAMDFANR